MVSPLRLTERPPRCGRIPMPRIHQAFQARQRSVPSSRTPGTRCRVPRTGSRTRTGLTPRADPRSRADPASRAETSAPTGSGTRRSRRVARLALARAARHRVRTWSRRIQTRPCQTQRNPGCAGLLTGRPMAYRWNPRCSCPPPRAGVDRRSGLTSLTRQTAGSLEAIWKLAGNTTRAGVHLRTAPQASASTVISPTTWRMVSVSPDRDLLTGSLRSPQADNRRRHPHRSRRRHLAHPQGSTPLRRVPARAAVPPAETPQARAADAPRT